MNGLALSPPALEPERHYLLAPEASNEDEEPKSVIHIVSFIEEEPIDDDPSESAPSRFARVPGKIIISPRQDADAARKEKERAKDDSKFNQKEASKFA